MVSLIISLIITAMLLIIPAFAYRNSSRLAMSLYRGMVETVWCKHLLAYVLAGFVIAYHLSFYQTHRTDIGLYVSSALMFATLSSRWVLVVLKAIRRNDAFQECTGSSSCTHSFRSAMLVIGCQLCLRFGNGMFLSKQIHQV